MQLFPRPNAILFILDPSIKMPSPKRNNAAVLKETVNNFLKNLEKKKIARAQRAHLELIKTINNAVGVKYFVQSPNGTLMYAVRTPIKKNNVRKVLKY